MSVFIRAGSAVTADASQKISEMEKGFVMKQFTRLTGPVANVTGLIKLKRLGKIRLGIKKKSAQSGKEYPSETPWFVVTPEVAEKYGENPTVLEGAMFSSNNPEEVYSEKLALYGKGTGLKCHGNGIEAMRRTEKGDWEPCKCPCPNLKTDENPNGNCKAKADLMIMLPKVSMWGNWQITTHSTIARAGILSSLKALKDMVGRIAYIPLRLERIPQPIVHGGQEKTHYIVGFTPSLTIPQIMELRSKPELMVLPTEYQIEGPVDSNPEDDPVDEVVNDEHVEDALTVDAEALANMSDAEMDRLKQQMDQKPPAHHEPSKPVEQPKPKPADAKANDISEEDWNEAIRAIEEDPNLRVLKDFVKVNMKIRGLKLLEKGKREFIRQFRIECEKEGFGAAVNRIFG